MNIIWLNDTVMFWLFKLTIRKKESPHRMRKEMKTGKGFLICSNHLNEGRNSGILSSKHNVCDCDVWFHNTGQRSFPWITNIVTNGMRFNNDQLIIFINKLTLRSSWVSDELTFNPEDNDVAPDEPILLQMECDWIIIN